MRRGCNIVLWAVLMVSVLLNLYFVGCYRTDRCHRIENDTIYVHDTVRIVEPVCVKGTIVRYDTIFFPIVKELDSIGNDSVYVEIPITQKVYEDSLYRVWVSGYNPRLDSLHLYHKEVYYPMVIKKKVKPKMVVSAGVYGGFGVKGADYGVGISVGVPIWWW